jgi:hypothetical protein
MVRVNKRLLDFVPGRRISHVIAGRLWAFGEENLLYRGTWEGEPVNFFATFLVWRMAILFRPSEHLRRWRESRAGSNRTKIKLHPLRPIDIVHLFVGVHLASAQQTCFVDTTRSGRLR